MADEKGGRAGGHRVTILVGIVRNKQINNLYYILYAKFINLSLSIAILKYFLIHLSIEKMICKRRHTNGTQIVKYS